MSIQPELSRVFDLDKMSPRGSTYIIDATDQECLDLAKRFGLISLNYFACEVTISPGNKPLHFSLRGHFSAEVVQACVVTLEPVFEQIESDFYVWLMPEDEAETHDELPIDYEQKEDVEGYENNQIDLGELSSQYLSLELNPYPHAPGIDYEVLNIKIEQDVSENTSDETKTPFIVLKKLSKN